MPLGDEVETPEEHVEALLEGKDDGVLVLDTEHRLIVETLDLNG